MSTTGLSLSPTGYYTIPTTTASSTASSGTASSDIPDSDTVTLSAAAQSYLNSINGSSPSAGGFTLSSAQEQQIQSIIQKYAAAPNTQATFNAIQDELKAAGLSPDELAAKDIQNNGVSTALQIVEAFSGQTVSAPPSIGDEKANELGYINQVYAQFEQAIALNKTAGATAASTASSTDTTDTTDTSNSTNPATTTTTTSVAA